MTKFNKLISTGSVHHVSFPGLRKTTYFRQISKEVISFILITETCIRIDCDSSIVFTRHDLENGLIFQWFYTYEKAQEKNKPLLRL